MKEVDWRMSSEEGCGGLHAYLGGRNAVVQSLVVDRKNKVPVVAGRSQR